VSARARFVYVNDDGSARNLTVDESEYLATEFEFGDGARPYIKPRYEARTPDGRLLGFLERSKLPAHVTVHSTDSPYE
jgi:hypothetical protein